MMANELLPIGSVVQLEDSTGLVMIAGYLAITQSAPDYVWDYSGFRFPIGFTGDEEVYCFNHEQIAVIYARGYQDIEQERFMNRLSVAREQVDTVGDIQKPDSHEEEG